MDGASEVFDEDSKGRDVVQVSADDLDAKLAWRISPVLFFNFFFCLLVRSNLGNAHDTMLQDLGSLCRINVDNKSRPLISAYRFNTGRVF